MNYENVKLWFAKDENNEIITIDNINDLNKHNTYRCPICGSNLKPKAIESKRITPHFAHVDASKCNSETMFHWWFKNKFLEKGDKFIVVSDKKRTYVCKNILVEQSYIALGETYKPDITIITECGTIIYFEMAFSNKKKVKDYLDIWLELKNIVVEIDIKHLMMKDKIPIFKALFYDGKCFNTKRNDTYYNTIGKYKEEKFKENVSEEIKERFRKLDWFWNDVFRYKKGEVDIKYIVDLIDYIDDRDYDFINELLTKIKCSNIMKEYIENKTKTTYQKIKKAVIDIFGENYLEYIRYDVGYSRLLGEYEGSISYYNLSENCWYMYSTDRFNSEDIVDVVIKCIKSNIKSKIHNKKVKKYNVNSKIIQNEINFNEKIQNFINELKRKHKNYDLQIWVRHYDSRSISDDDLNDNIHKILVTLRYGFVTAHMFEVTSDFKHRNVNIILNTIVDKLNTYFAKLNVLTQSNILKLNSLTCELKDIFSGCGLDTSGKLWFEDVYEISNSFNYKLNSYYFSNEGLIDNLRNGKLILSFDRFDDIRSFLIKDTTREIIDYHTNECCECGNDFYLSIGELKFYNKKGFKMPKRCKSCREKRKEKKK